MDRRLPGEGHPERSEPRMSTLGPDNAIFYAQFHLRGGWRNTLTVAGAYAVIVGGLVLLSVYIRDPNGRLMFPGALSWWIVALLVIQTAALVLYGATRVTAAIRKDVAGHMIESHRL